MYNQNNQLPQVLADFIQQSAQMGVVQNHIWQCAAQNNWQNDFFNQMLNTLTETVTYWSGNGTQQVDLNQAVSTVYHCKGGIEVTRYPQMAQQMTQQDYNNWIQWANQAQGLSQELNQFMSQFRTPQYGGRGPGMPLPATGGRPMGNPTNAWDVAQQQQQGGWGAPVNNGWGQQANPNPNQSFAVGNQAPPNVRQAPAPQQQHGNMYTPRLRGRYGNNTQQQSQPQTTQHRPTTVLKEQPNQAPQFTKPRTSNWRSHANKSNQTRFDPSNPQHAPVGREVAEQHEAAANAAGSWDNSDFSWDDNLSFEEKYVPEAKPTVSHVSQNNSNTPQFMERLSSNPDVDNLIYGKDTETGYYEFDISDWRTKPDPDFPWEIGYTPATRTRRIAFDVKRQCYVQIIEENAVRYEDHEILDRSAAVRNTPASKARPERQVVDIDKTKVVTLGELSTRRQEILDHRLDAVKETWDHQEAEAQDKAKDSGNYVAPELTPSREEALDTPHADETEADALVVVGQLEEDQIINVDLGKETYLTEQHALFGAQSKVAESHFDATDAPLLLTRYVETTPFMLNPEEAEHALAKLKPLTSASELKTLVDMAKYLNSIVDDVPTYLWNAIDDQLTGYINSVLATEMGLDGFSIESFAEDAADLPKYLNEHKGKRFLEALSRNIAEFMAPLRCVSFDRSESELAEQTVLLRRETTLAKLAFTSKELGLFADKTEFGITESSAPNIHKLLTKILEQTARADGSAGYHKRVLLLDDGVRFTIHKGWMGDRKVLILKR